MNYYKILNVSPSASVDEISSSFRNLAKKYHPDLNNNHDAKQRFIEIFEAYEILRNDEKRKLYDESIDSENSKDKFERYEQYKNEAKEAADKYSNKKYADFYDDFIKKSIEIGKSVANATFIISVKIIWRIIIFGCMLIGSIIILKISSVVIVRDIRNERQIMQEEISQLVDTMDKYLIEYPMKKNAIYSLKSKKIIIIDVEKNKISEIYYELPMENRAHSENEIDYVIQLNKTNHVVGKYTDGTSAIKISYVIRIVDYRNKETVSIDEIIGSDPPYKNGGIMGNSGIDPIKKYLEKIIIEL